MATAWTTQDAFSSRFVAPLFKESSLNPIIAPRDRTMLGRPGRQPRLARLAAALTRPSRTPASRCPGKSTQGRPGSAPSPARGHPAHDRRPAPHRTAEQEDLHNPISAPNPALGCPDSAGRNSALRRSASHSATAAAPRPVRKYPRSTWQPRLGWPPYVPRNRIFCLVDMLSTVIGSRP
jgi:hypothetical protein